jgi:glycosyltransferase involved in cell wall biosynthesis
VQRFLPSRSRGGVGVFTSGLASALARRGHQITVVSQDPAPETATYRVVRVPMPDGRLAPLAFPFALRRVDFREFDVIHAQGDDQWLSRRTGPPLVRTLHGTALAEAWFNGVRGRSPKRLFLHTYFYLSECVADLRADVVVAVSEDTRRYYPRVDRVIPNGIDLDAWAPDGSPKSAAPSILFVGEVDSRKRGRLVLDAFGRDVRPEVPDAQLWVVSPDPVEAPGVHWKGRVPDSELQTLMRQAWIMCLPSAYEGFGRPYAEALAAGTVAVATPNPGAREVLEDGRGGLIVPDASLGTALVRLLRDPLARQPFERRGLERARSFSWETVAASYEDAYELAISRRRARHA